MVLSGSGSGSGRWLRGVGSLVADQGPQDVDLAGEGDELDLAVIETKLNTRPRQILGWKTPAEAFGLAT